MLPCGATVPTPLMATDEALLTCQERVTACPRSIEFELALKLPLGAAGAATGTG